MYYKEAINTAKAGWLELKLAKMFGKKLIGRDGNSWVMLSVWRGKRYFIAEHIDGE